MKIILKSIKKIGRFYWNCVEMPKQDLEKLLPNFSSFFYFIYFLMFAFSVNPLTDFLKNIHPLINSILEYFLFVPVFIVLMYRMYKDK